MKIPTSLKITIGVIIIAALAMVVWHLSSQPRNQTSEAPSPTTATMTLPEKYNFSITCPTGTNGYEHDGSYVCSDSPDGMWQGQVDVTDTSVSDVQEIVRANNAKLALTDSAYMSIVRETTVDGTPSIIVKQTFGSEAGPTSDGLAKTLLVIHDGRLYSIHTREYQTNVDEFFASFHFTK